MPKKTKLTSPSTTKIPEPEPLLERFGQVYDELEESDVQLIMHALHCASTSHEHQAALLATPAISTTDGIEDLFSHHRNLAITLAQLFEKFREVESAYEAEVAKYEEATCGDMER